jgi:hypothetical protein
VAAAVVLAISAVVIMVSFRPMTVGNGIVPSAIQSGGFLEPGQAIASRNGQFTLVMQSDGNLVEYRMPQRVVRWESGTSGNFNAYVVMQGDGDLVVYPPGKTAPAPGQPTSALWSSGTFGNPGSSTALLDSGELLVKARTGVVLWEMPPPVTN